MGQLIGLAPAAPPSTARAAGGSPPPAHALPAEKFVDGAVSLEASPWTDWLIAREIEDACLPWRVTAAFRKRRWRRMSEEDLEEVREALSEAGHRNELGPGKWPAGPTPDRMIGERIGCTEFDPQFGDCVAMTDRTLRQRYHRVTRYLMPALDRRIPASVKRGRDTLDRPSVLGPMLVECVAWFRERHGRWPGHLDFEASEALPPLEFLDEHQASVAGLVRATRPYFERGVEAM